MRKTLKYILGVVISAILLLSIVYMSSEHEYDLVKIEEVQTDENFINIRYEKEEQVEEDEGEEEVPVSVVEVIKKRGVRKMF